MEFSWILRFGTAFSTIAVVLITLKLWRCRCSNRRQRPQDSKVSTLVVLGSGGHTTEMLHLLSKIQTQRYQPLFYVLADTDHTSKAKFEASPLAPRAADYIRIPRAREVGESWAWSLVKTVYACIYAVAVVARKRPELIICNGPGTCLPVCLAAFALRCCFLLDVHIVFCESFCRVRTLSLTGKILYKIADRFVVQWPNLRERYPRAEYLGIIC